MENFDRENIDELLEIRQYFPHQNFAPYGIYLRYEWNNRDVLVFTQVQEERGELL